MEVNNTDPQQNHSFKEHKKRAPTSLTVECGVCGSPAPDHIHFGARCCYSCRAFFRRRAQRHDSQRCRSNNGECDISPKSKKCIACRYNKCLHIGMDPALVQGTRKKQFKSEPLDYDDDEVHDHEEDDNEEPTTSNLSSQSLNHTPPIVGNFTNFRSALFNDSHQEGKEEVKRQIPTLGFSYNHIQPNSNRLPDAATSGIYSNTIKNNILPEHPPGVHHPFRKIQNQMSDIYDKDSPAPGPSLFQRPSVIRRAGREDPSKLQLRADILKFHGNILTHTGNLFSYHAELLNQKQTKQNTKEVHEVKYDIGSQSLNNHLNIKTEPELVLKKENLETLRQSSDNNEDNFEDIADKVFEEAQELLVNSPWIIGFEPNAEQPNCIEGPLEKDQILNWLQDDSASYTPPPFHSPSSSSSPSCQTSVIQKK